MVDIERLDAFLMSDDAPENCMQISDLDGFLTGILCSPDLIMPSEWLPLVWGNPEPALSDEGLWAVQEILRLYNEIATGLNADPPELDPVFWEQEGGAVIAMDWCEGFMDAFVLREQQWEELMETEQGQDWMFPILAHLFDDEGNSLSGATKEELPAALDEAAQLIPVSVSKIFVFWRSRRSPHAETGDAAAASPHIAPTALPRYAPDDLRELTEKDLFALLLGHEDRVPMEIIKECAAREDAMVPLLHQHLKNEANWSADADLRDWWALLHAVMVLGLITGEASAAALLEGFRRINSDDENDLADWFAGYWPALFRNKSQFSTASLRAIADDPSLRWYPRLNAVECVLADAAAKGAEELEAAIDWVAALVDDNDADPDFRAITVTKLLEFPRRRHRALLETIAREQKSSDIVGIVFVDKDIDVSFERGDRPQWLRFDNPWRFYTPESIGRRQERWAQEDARREERGIEKKSDDSPWATSAGMSLGDTYVRHVPKIGRNDPCPCGSGKKYKKCCLTRVH